MLFEHPHDLTELLHELPWWPAGVGRMPEAARRQYAVSK